MLHYLLPLTPSGCKGCGLPCRLNLDNTVLTQGTQTWVSYWVELVQACSQDPVTAGRLMIDILNEPDVVSMQWSAQNGVPGDPLPLWRL